jgi:hypothetical protein
MNKTIVNIERISGGVPKLNIAKSAFFDFESGAFNHSATLPRVNTGRYEPHFARVSSMGKFIRRLQTEWNHGAHFALFSRSTVV